MNISKLINNQSLFINNNIQYHYEMQKKINLLPKLGTVWPTDCANIGESSMIKDVSDGYSNTSGPASTKDILSWNRKYISTINKEINSITL